MTTLLLVRHGETDAVGKILAGWQPGWSLNDMGRIQADTLSQRLSSITLQAIYTSPLERARETAEAIAKPSGLSPIVRDRLGELRFGDWEGRSIDSLTGDSAWQHFNTQRSIASPPGGERMIEAQSRMVAESEHLRFIHPNAAIALVSHGDPLRALIAHYLGSPLDLIHRIDLDTASLTVVQFRGRQPVVARLNDTGEAFAL